MDTQKAQDDAVETSQDNQAPAAPDDDGSSSLPQNTPAQAEAAPLQPGLTPQEIRFANKNRARLIAPPPEASPPEIVSALGLEQPDGLLLMVGGETSMDAEIEAHLIQLFSRGLARAAADANAAIIDGGREVGAMAIMGRGVADRGHKSALVGVAPAGNVTFPGGPEPDGTDAQPLDPNHSHFVLADGHQPGDETDTLFQVATALAGSRQIVTILVHGDTLAKKQILYSVRQGWPVIIIKGSGGLADEIADLWQKRPHFIPDPDLAEITIDGKLHFYQLGGAISEFERRLEQLLHHQEAESATTLELAWQLFAEYDQNANRQQRTFNRLQTSILVLGVLGTLLALTEFTFKSNFDIQGNYLYFVIERTMYYTLLAVPIIVAALIAAANRFSAGNKWILLRASAESIKKEIYRYRTRTEIYSDRETKKTSREVKLERKIESLSRKLMQTEVNMSAIRPYTGPIPPKHGAASGDDGLSFLTPERYLTHRLLDQLGYYRNKTVKLEKRLQQLQWLSYIAGGAGTLLVAIGLELWIALTTSLVTAFSSYLEYQQVENTLMRYNQTATDLANVRSWWVSLSTEEQADPRNIDKLVGQTETSIHSEHAAWVQEMQDAMAELRAEQTGEEQSQGDEAEGGPERTQTGTLLITNINR